MNHQREEAYLQNNFFYTPSSKELNSVFSLKNDYRTLRSMLGQRAFMKIAFEDGLTALESHRKLVEHDGREALWHPSVTGGVENSEPADKTLKTLRDPEDHPILESVTG
jgi:hypothetical protein